MKKRRNIAAAIVLSSMMAVSTCAFTVTSMTAFADNTLTVSDASTRTYEVYQIFTGTLSGDKLSDIQWGNGVTSAGKTALGDAKTKAGAITTEAGAISFANDVAPYLDSTNKQLVGKGAGASNTNLNSLTLAPGYYLVKDVTDLSNQNDASSRYILKVVKDVSIEAKKDVPTSNKTVTDVNDSIGASETQSGQSTADYDIGDSIPYVLEFTLPADYDTYVKYPVTFIDDMCAGLTLDASSVQISYDGGTTFTPLDSSAYSTAPSTSGGTTLTYSIADLKSNIATYSSGAKVVIKYSATLNSSAVVGSAGNPNTYKVQFANDPKWNGTGDSPKGETPPSTNKVYTYKLVINKVEPDGNSTKPLTGADFILYKFIADPSGTSTLDSSTTIKGNWVDVTSLNTESGAANPTKTKSGNGTVADFVFTFSGLDDGWYKLHESVTPAGYNSIDDKIFQITPTANGDLENILSPIALTADDTAGSLTGNVVNNQGATLPSTGGIGTTLFYIIGGTLVAGSIVLLITKKRMHSTEE